jgi:hypothetical protein
MIFSLRTATQHASVAYLFCTTLLLDAVHASPLSIIPPPQLRPREGSVAARDLVSITADWRFQRWNSSPDGLSYDTLKPWVLPSANDFIVDGTKHERPSDTPPGADVEYVDAAYDDSDWQAVTLPHDWAT